MIDFELVIPTGWVHIPTLPEYAKLRDRNIEEIIKRALPDTLPRDKAGPWRKMLRKDMVEAAVEAQRQGARGLVMPLTEMQGMRLPGSLLLTVIGADEGEPEDPTTVLNSVLADAGDNGIALEIGGCPAVRVQQIIDSEPLKRKAPSVRVSYFVAAPDHPGVWGLLTFTVLTDGDVEAEEVQAITLLFDAVVGTLRWADRVDVPTEDEVLAQMPSD
ncbi:hypothetical protein [Actinoplanes couchii]|uniref:Uncharacterized protein n=1 Tax=Actinoplanes couchii TaxID=403638 RepID=A0ABQ3X3T2_9ACTN|nr:hypothetical protein [Actinoplanes couchii]MDR6322924.1 hypothetical protein [Actinoplanes couchii]GID53164.1 hypothetical protein Aco03nite_015680 [Actinoplanes couchii]